MRESAAKLIRHTEHALGKALGGMTGQEFSVAAVDESDAPDLAEPIIWEQVFSNSPDSTLWLAAGKDLWAATGEWTLAAVGIESPTDEDCRATWKEICGQTMGAIAAAVTADIEREITSVRGGPRESLPEATWTSFTVQANDGAAWSVKAAWSSALVAVYEAPKAPEKPTELVSSAFSKTFDLLLDVALPVSVSFGKTSLQIREVLKLNTGSIVELDRFVAEPVDVVVNNCVIARGEVVVVDGNYGVRVTQLASREERLRSGMADGLR